MSQQEFQLEVVEGNALTPPQLDFANHWSREYFGAVAVTKGLEAAPVHWRLFLRSEDELLCHVAITKMGIEVDGAPRQAGAIGGLITPTTFQGRGLGNALMDRAEDFIFSELSRPLAILFCLEELVPFYARRDWSVVTHPVTLEQKDRVVTWGAAVMILQHDRKQDGTRSIHVPRSSSK